MNEYVEAARKYLGVPWKHQGRSRHGLDCAGLLVLSMRDCGRELEDIDGYSRHPWRDGLMDAVGKNFSKSDSSIEPGDILVFRITRFPQHLAMATEKGIIHSYIDAGGVAENSMDDYWKERLMGIYKP